MTHARQRLGEEGERLAAAYLEERGYRVHARRWRAAGREVDLVAEKDGVVVLVEVKTRRSPIAPPETAVDWRKRRQLVAVGRAACQRWPGHVFRFDVVSVVVGDREPRIVHIADAFRAS